MLKTQCWPTELSGIPVSDPILLREGALQRKRENHVAGRCWGDGADQQKRESLITKHPLSEDYWSLCLELFIFFVFNDSSWFFTLIRLLWTMKFTKRKIRLPSSHLGQVKLRGQLKRQCWPYDLSGISYSTTPCCQVDDLIHQYHFPLHFLIGRILGAIACTFLCFRTLDSPLMHNIIEIWSKWKYAFLTILN